MNIQLSQSQLAHLLIAKIKEFGTSTSGIYNNRIDPTHFEKGKACFYVGSAPVKTEEYPGEEYLPEILEVEFHDSTWGIDFEFTFVRADGAETKSSGYFGRSNNEWCRITGVGRADQNARDFERDFVNALTSESWNSFVERERDMDPAGGYGRESHR
jgi:hypothetical protein